jgi:hypothetical protein
VRSHRGSRQRLARAWQRERGSRAMWLVVALAGGMLALYSFMLWCECA